MDFYKKIFDDNKFATLIVLLAILSYFVGFIAYYPNNLTITDELHYVGQSTAIADHLWQIIFSDNKLKFPETYPIGTALLQAPFVYCGGWRAATIPSMVAFLCTIIILAKWLRFEHKNMIFAMLVFTFPAALVIGRSAMSDCLCGFIVTLGLYLYWIMDERPWFVAFTCGLLGGLSTLFKEPSFLIFVPFFLGKLFKKDKSSFLLIIGCLCGLFFKVWSNQIFFGDPFYLRPPDHYRFTLASIYHNLPYYLILLTILIPGGTISLLYYRDKYRYEIISAIFLYLLVFLCLNYSADTTSYSKRIILSGRYMIPLLPLFTITLADTAPRLYNKIIEYLGLMNYKAVGQYAIKVSGMAVLIVIVLIYYLVNPVMYNKFNYRTVVLQDIMMNIEKGEYIITNSMNTSIYLTKIYSGYDMIVNDKDYLTFNDIDNIRNNYKKICIILLDRNEYKDDRKENSEYINKMSKKYNMTLVWKKNYAPGDHLSIWIIND